MRRKSSSIKICSGESCATAPTKEGRAVGRSKIRKGHVVMHNLPILVGIGTDLPGGDPAPWFLRSWKGMQF